MAVTKASVILDMAHEHFPSFLRQREHVRYLDGWVRGRQEDGLYLPQEQTLTDEYKDLAAMSRTPWLGLVVTSLAQTIYLDGVRRSGDKDNMAVWDIWQSNQWDGRQSALYRGAISHGLSFATALPGVDPLTGEKTAIIRPVSATKMAAFYDDDVDDEWPRMALRAEPVIERIPGAVQSNRYPVPASQRTGWTVRIYDEDAIHYLAAKGDGYDRADWTYISYELHPAGVPPVVRYAPKLDLEGRANSHIEPFIPLARRIDQDTFDRLIVQRFGAWKVRYISGMAVPDDPAAEALRLSVENLLVSSDKDTKFGTLDETQLDGFIKSRDADLRDLSALSQTPPHHLLGLSSNLQAEALATAESGLQRLSGDARIAFGESHEQLFRLVSVITGNQAEARAHDMQSRWRDTETRSLAQAADALGKVATLLKVPVEMLWERIPGWTDSDTERAKELVQSGGFDQLVTELLSQVQGNDPAAGGQQGTQTDTGAPSGGNGAG